MITTKIEITYSKLIAFLILSMGFTLSVLTKDLSTFVIAAPIAATTIVMKQRNDKEIQKITSDKK